LFLVKKKLKTVSDSKKLGFYILNQLFIKLFERSFITIL